MAVSGWGVLTLLAIKLWVPVLPGLPDKGLAGQFAFLKTPAPWLLLAAIMFGNGSIFCWYSYINPIMTKVAGFAPEDLTFLMMVSGAGMVFGNLASGWLSDVYSPAKIALVLQALTAVVLLLIFLTASDPSAAVFLMFAGMACLFGLSSPQQVLIIKYAPGGEMLGASGAQVFFNLGNALGAFSGGLPISWGYAYNYAALPGAAFAVAGFGILWFFRRKYVASAV